MLRTCSRRERCSSLTQDGCRCAKVGTAINPQAAWSVARTMKPHSSRVCASEKQGEVPAFRDWYTEVKRGTTLTSNGKRPSTGCDSSHCRQANPNQSGQSEMNLKLEAFRKCAQAKADCARSKNFVRGTWVQCACVRWFTPGRDSACMCQEKNWRAANFLFNRVCVAPPWFASRTPARCSVRRTARCAGSCPAAPGQHVRSALLVLWAHLARDQWILVYLVTSVRPRTGAADTYIFTHSGAASASRRCFSKASRHHRARATNARDESAVFGCRRVPDRVKGAQSLVCVWGGGRCEL